MKKLEAVCQQAQSQLHKQWDALEAICYRLTFTEETVIWHGEHSVALSGDAMYGLALTLGNFREAVEKVMDAVWDVCGEMHRAEQASVGESQASAAV